MDVKTGSGAFMPTLEQARALARSIVGVAHGAGLPTAALLTEMGQCLGHTAGNAVEVAGEHRHAARASRRTRGSREVVLELCGEALALARLAPDAAAGRAAAAAALASGAAAERFARMVARAGRAGATCSSGTPGHLPRAPLVRAGARPAGRPCARGRRPGAGPRRGRARRRPAPCRAMPSTTRSGLSEVRGIGDEVGPDAPLALIHGRDEATVAAAAKRLRDAYMIESRHRRRRRRTIHERIV